jgi:hypothetical protein
VTALTSQSQETAKSRTNESSDIILSGVSTDSSHLPNEKPSSKANGAGQQSETRIVTRIESLECDIAKRDTSPNAKQGAAYPTKRHPTLLRIQLKQAAKSKPRNRMQLEKPAPHLSVCDASVDGESPKALGPLARAQVDQWVPSGSPRTEIIESKSGTANAPVQTRTDLDTSHSTAAHLQRNADGVEPGNLKADGKNSGTSNSIARERTDGKRFQSLPNPGEPYKKADGKSSGISNSLARERKDGNRLQNLQNPVEPSKKVDGMSSGSSNSLARERTDGNRVQSLPNPGEPSESSKALPRVGADAGQRNVLPDADRLLFSPRDEHGRELCDVASNAKSLAQGNSRTDNTSAEKISARTKLALNMNSNDSASVRETGSRRLDRAPEPSHPVTTRAIGQTEAPQKVHLSSTKLELERNQLVSQQ